MHALVRNLGGVEGNETFICTGDTRANDLVVLPSGIVGFVLGNRDYVAGEEVAVTTDAIIDVDSASATTISAGATARFDTSTKLAITSGGVGLGEAELAKTSGQTKMRVRLNKLNIA